MNEEKMSDIYYDIEDLISYGIDDEMNAFLDDLLDLTDDGVTDIETAKKVLDQLENFQYYSLESVKFWKEKAEKADQLIDRLKKEIANG